MEQYRVEVDVATSDQGFRVEQVRCNGKTVAQQASDDVPETYLIKGIDFDVETFIGVYERFEPLGMPWSIKELEQDHTFKIEVTVETGEDLPAEELADCDAEELDWLMNNYHGVEKVVIDGQEAKRQLGVGYDDTSYWPLVVEPTRALVVGHYIYG